MTKAMKDVGCNEIRCYVGFQMAPTEGLCRIDSCRVITQAPVSGV